jgi:hypothetical protein
MWINFKAFAMLIIAGISSSPFSFLIKKPYYLEKKYHALMSVVF